MAYVNLTNIFNGKEKFDVDFCHVIPKGGEMIAAALASRAVTGHGRRRDRALRHGER